jgi:pimeloyl-ACP methyl ester carboxylesterase
MLQAQKTIRQPVRLAGPRKRMDMTARLGGLGGARTALQTVARAAKVQVHEAALVLSVPAAAPVRLIRGEYRSANSVPPQMESGDTAARPVLLVHGFGGAKSSWSLVAQALSAQGMSVDAMAYAPVGNSVEQLADKLVARVQTILSRTGAGKVHLVGHSLGGVIIAQAISDPRRVSVGRRAAGGRHGPRATGGVTPVDPPRLRAIARRCAVALSDGLARRGRAGPAVGAAPPSGGDHHGRWRRPSGDAAEPAGNRIHNRRTVRGRPRNRRRAGSAGVAESLLIATLSIHVVGRTVESLAP